MNFPRSASLVVLFLSFVLGLSAQNNIQWQGLQGPPAADVYAIAQLDAATGLIGSSRGIFQNQQGQNWGKLNAGRLSDSTVYHLITLPGGVALAGTATGVFKASTQVWQVWTAIPDARLRDKITALQFDAVRNRVWAATQQNGVLFSDDLGQNWQSSTLTANGVANFWFDAARILAADSAGVYASANNGADWALAATPRPVTSLTRLANTNVYFAGTQGKGVFMSLDSATTWTPANGNMANARITCLLADALGNLFAGTQSGLVYQTADSGAVWQVKMALPGPSPILTMKQLGSTLLAGTYRYGLYRSTDGVVWTETNKGLTNSYIKAIAVPSARRIFASVEDVGLFISADTGRTWALSNNGIGSYQINALFAHNTDTLLAGVVGAGRVYRTVNSGQTWQPAGTGLDSVLQVNTLTRGQDGALYAGTVNRGLFVSQNWGESWTALPANGLDSKNVSAIYAFSPDSIIIGTRGKGVYLWKNNVWTNIGLETQAIQALLRRNADDSLWAAASRGLYVWNGAAWAQRYETGFDQIVNGLVQNPQGDLFASISQNGVLRSINGGLTWTPENSGLSAKYLTCLAIDDSTHLYAGTSGYGLDKSSATERLVISRDEEALAAFLEIYPNPVVEHFTLRWQAVQAARFEAVLVDPAGQTVARLSLADLPAGLHSAVFDAQNLPAGAYRLLLLANGKPAQTAWVIRR